MSVYYGPTTVAMMTADELKHHNEDRAKKKETLLVRPMRVYIDAKGCNQFTSALNRLIENGYEMQGEPKMTYTEHEFGDYVLYGQLFISKT